MSARVSTGRLAKREARRGELLSGVPAWYSPWGHLALNLSLSLSVCVLAATHLRNVRSAEWGTVVVMFLVANGFEWATHRWLMHLSRPWSRGIYRRHAGLHHTLFLGEDMPLRTWRELRFILIHPLDLLSLLFAVLTLACVWGLFTSVNAGLLAAATLAGYVVGYELSHMLYHWPVSGRGSGVVLALRRHHAIHHHAPLMSRWNFNVTLPLFDWLCGTAAPRELSEQVA